MKIYHVSEDPEGYDFLDLEVSKLFLSSDKAYEYVDERNREVQELAKEAHARTVKQWETVIEAAAMLKANGIDPQEVFKHYQLTEPHFYPPITAYSVHELEVEE